MVILKQVVRVNKREKQISKSQALVCFASHIVDVPLNSWWFIHSHYKSLQGLKSWETNLNLKILK